MIIALETAGPTSHIWLYDAENHELDTRAWESGRQLSAGLHGWLCRFLADHQLELEDVTGFIIFSGPGSFTSLRIGHATINALADALHVPVAGAMGGSWRTDGLEQIRNTPAGRPALPHYGSEANITRPKH